MNMKGKVLAFIVVLSFAFSSCGEYQKALKSDDYELKYKVAKALYDKGDYNRSMRLWEKVVGYYIGRPQGEDALYMYADSFYKRKKYLLAGYQYERFLKNYPRSEKAEEVLFLQGECNFLESPKYSLDQEATYKALDQLQEYIDRYPNGAYLREANNMVLELLNKLQHKSFEIAKGYDKIRDYQAAIKSFDNFLVENPGSTFREEAMYYRLHSAYELAKNSIKSKEKQRFEEAKNYYELFSRTYPESNFMTKANKMYQDILKKISELW